MQGLQLIHTIKKLIELQSHRCRKLREGIFPTIDTGFGSRSFGHGRENESVNVRLGFRGPSNLQERQKYQERRRTKIMLFLLLFTGAFLHFIEILLLNVLTKKC